jgi:hypothetical protein
MPIDVLTSSRQAFIWHLIAILVIWPGGRRDPRAFIVWSSRRGSRSIEHLGSHTTTRSWRRFAEQADHRIAIMMSAAEMR